MRDLVEARGIKLAMLNIRSGREVGLEAALRALKQVNIYVGLLQEMKLTNGIHARQGAGCAIWATEAEIRHQGGIEVVRRKESRWQV